MMTGCPRLSLFYGIVIYMYVRDHGVGHIHAWHGDDEARLRHRYRRSHRRELEAAVGLSVTQMDRSP